jgi:hypothetical protein
MGGVADNEGYTVRNICRFTAEAFWGPCLTNRACNVFGLHARLFSFCPQHSDAEEMHSLVPAPVLSGALENFDLLDQK